MKISNRGEYALRALIDTGFAKELGRELVRINELAEQERPPVKFLEQILTQLKEAGYVDSKRGRYGAHKEINSRKADRLPEEAGLRLRRQPSASGELPATVLIRNAHRVRDWEIFLKS